MLETIADIRLENEDRWMLAATLRTINPWRKERDAFAHKIWGFSPDIPNALLLSEPLLKLHVVYNSDPTPSTMNFITPEVDHSQVRVYTEDDLKAAAELAAEAHRLVRLLPVAIEKKNNRDVARAKLLTHPQIKDRYDNMERAG